jgi:hypothetical protein
VNQACVDLITLLGLHSERIAPAEERARGHPRESRTPA